MFSALTGHCKSRVSNTSNKGISIIEKLEKIQQNILDDQRCLSSKYPNWDTKEDIRNTVFFRFINALNSIKLSIIFIEQHLKDNRWWRKSFPEITSHDKQIQLREFAQSTKHHFGLSIFILIENAFRIFLRAIDPAACNSGTDAFESIYKCLLNSKLVNTPSSTAIELLELVRLVRNTIHNDGIYFHRNGKDIEVSYKGEKYQFIYGKPVEFVTWEFLLMLTDDIRELLVQTISDKAIAEIDTQIKDPFS
jgi:hypothetical protein